MDSLLQNKNIKRVVLISPSHIEAFRGASIYDGDAYSTPLGNVNIDKEFCRKLTAENSLIKLSSIGHESTYSGRSEHAL